jgi:long-chain fatty acid transport protein
LSIAAGPTITTGQVGLEPFVFAAPNSNGHYSPGQATRYHWGGGFQTGAYYIYSDALRFGASFKSPTWMEKFEFYGEDALGGPRSLLLDLDLPMIVSVGSSLSAGNGWLVALDLRFIDFANTAGLGDRAVFDSTGRLGGLDWSSVFVSALGVEKQMSDAWTVRGGYTYNQNPIKNSEAFYSVASPLIYQHTLSSGVSYNASETLSVNLAYSYLLENSRHGQLILPASGPLAGSSISNSMDAHFLSFGLTIRQ